LVTLLAPICVIADKYKLFNSGDTAAKPLTGLGFIVILSFAVIGLRKLKTVITNMPGISVKQQRWKNAFLMIYSAIVPGIVLICLWLFKQDATTAYETVKICI